MIDIVRGLDASVVFSSHIMEDVAALATETLVLHQGRVVFSGATQDLAARAPAGTEAERRAEAGFLATILHADGCA